MNILYFARIRETVGCSEEKITLPASVTTVAELMDHLRAQGEQYASAFADEALIRVAVGETYVDFNHAVSDTDEVAFFPPMTGG